MNNLYSENVDYLKNLGGRTGVKNCRKLKTFFRVFIHFSVTIL